MIVRTLTIFAVTALGLFAHATAASGCGSSASPRALQLTGTVIEGGAPGSFQKLVDLKTGHSRITKRTGPMTGSQGFNGLPWSAGNGIVVHIDLPSSVSVARARAEAERSASLNGRSQITIQADDGPETLTFGDWRCVGALRYPFEQTDTDSTGERTTLRIQTAKLVTVTPAMFEAPSPQPHGTIGAGVPADVPFTFTGKRAFHIIAPAVVNGHASRLIFDTGGANYFGVTAAQRLGLMVSGGVNISGIGTGSISGGYAQLDSISIGAATLSNETAVVAPLPWPETPTAPDGLTGFEFFAEFRTTIDYDRQILRFEDFGQPLPAGGQRLPFYSDEHAMYVDAEVNGTRGTFRIDTGDSGGVTLFKTFAKRIGVEPTAGTPNTSGGGVGGHVSLLPVRLHDFEFAGTQLNDVPARLSQMNVGAFSSRTLAGNLGGRLFHCFVMTIDYRARVIVINRHKTTDDCLKNFNAVS